MESVFVLLYSQARQKNQVIFALYLMLVSKIAAVACNCATACIMNMRIRKGQIRADLFYIITVCLCIHIGTPTVAH